MKNKLFTIILAVIMVFSMSFSVFAAQNVDSGKSGPSTITITNATIDEDYEAIKLFDATVSVDGSNIVYKLPSGKTDLKATVSGEEVDGADWFELATDGTVTAKGTLADSVLKSDAFKNWAKAYGASQASATATDAEINFQNLPYGYYFVTSSLGAIASVTSTKPTATIIDKNQGPSWDNGDDNPGKVIKETGKVLDPEKCPGEGELTDSHDAHTDECYSDGIVSVSTNEAHLDEEIKFDIGVNATNYDGEDKINSYIITDTIAAGMTYLSDPAMTVKVGDTTVNAYNADTNKNGYTITYYKDADATTGQETTTLSEARSFKITIPWVDANTADATNDYQRDHLYANSVEIHVAYSAKLDSAKAKDVNYAGANENKAKFQWTEVGSNGTPTAPQGGTPEKTTETYITELEITKHDGSNNILTGAEFTLTGPTGEVIYTQGSKYVKWVKDDDVTAEKNDGTDYDAKGNAQSAYTYWKLKDGSYTTTDPATDGIDSSVYESTTDKYMLQTYKEVQGPNQTSTSIVSYVGTDGKAKFSGLSVGEYTLTETKTPSGYNTAPAITFYVTFDPATKKFSVQNSAADTANGTGITLSDSNKILEKTVINTKGEQMPSTGGLGRTIMLILGAIVAVLAAIFLVTRRRVSYNMSR